MIDDSLGVCLFAHVAVKGHHDIPREMVKGRWGWEWGAGEIREMAIVALQEERDIQPQGRSGPGHRPASGNLFRRTNPSSGTTFDFSPEELEAIEYH